MPSCLHMKYECCHHQTSCRGNPSTTEQSVRPSRFFDAALTSAVVYSFADLFVVRGGVLSVVEQVVHPSDGQQDAALSRVLLAFVLSGGGRRFVHTMDRAGGMSGTYTQASWRSSYLPCSKGRKAARVAARVEPGKQHSTTIARNNRVTFSQHLKPPLLEGNSDLCSLE